VLSLVVSYVGRMASKNGKILHFVNPCPVHPEDVGTLWKSNWNFFLQVCQCCNWWANILSGLFLKKVLLRHCSETVVKYRAVTATDCLIGQ
jgi:hypothetical protein